MMNVLKGLQELKAEVEILRRNPLAAPLDPRKECAPLVKARDDLRLHSKTPRISAPPLDPQMVWHRFESVGEEITKLNSLEFRSICTDSEFAVRPAFVNALQAHLEPLMRRQCLNGLVNAYFVRWRSMEAPEDLERLLKAAIATFPRKHTEIERWRTAKSLFSPQAADKLAEFVVDRQANTETVLNLQQIKRSTGLANVTRCKTAELATQRFRAVETSSSEEVNLDYLRWLIKDVLADEIMQPGALHSAVSLLILSQSADKSAPFQQALRNFAQNHPRLGDPRVRQSAPNWRDMEQEATQRFLSWLAKENILFFFNTILPSNDENRRRAEFWLRYHTKIKDFQVAISEQDFLKMKANKAVIDIPHHSRVEHPTTSAFLMQFQGFGAEYVIVEFSEKGNAAHIHERGAFESRNVNLRTPYFQVNRHLKHERRGAFDRILHQADWEIPTRQKLAQLGIRP